MAGSALRWAAFNLHLAARFGLRHSILRDAEDPGDPCGALMAAARRLGPAWDDAARQEMERAARFGATILTLEDDGYPVLLRRSPDPPPLLNVRGALLPEDVLAIAVVGSRRATPQGVLAAERIAAGLAAAGFTVVSGLARGIDAAAHRGALAAGGRTIAVLGSGLNRIYPAEHRAMAESIASRGALLSEFPYGAPPLARHFPERNRVIAWMTWATVVVEAARDSGSLITANLALDGGRAVFAVPGPIDAPGSEGTNGILREGAILCRSAEDVLQDLAAQVSEAARLRARRPGAAKSADGAHERGPAPRGIAAEATGPEARRVLEALRPGRAVGIEALGTRCGLEPGPLLAALLELELAGLVRPLPGRRFLAVACKI